MVDEAHGVGVLGARGAGRLRAVRRRGRGRPADGHVLQVDRVVRRLHRRAGRRHRVPAHPVALVHVHGVGGAGGGRRGAGGGEDHQVAPRGRSCSRGCSTTPPTCEQRADASAASRSSPAGNLPDGDPIVTPIVPGAGRRRLGGGAALEGALRRRRLHERRALPGGPARRRAAAHERDGDARARAPRPRARRSSTAPAEKRARRRAALRLQSARCRRRPKAARGRGPLCSEAALQGRRPAPT